MTIVLGIVGSFVGGFLGYLFFHNDADGRLLPAGGNHRLDHRRDHRAADLCSGHPSQHHQSTVLTAVDQIFTCFSEGIGVLMNICIWLAGAGAQL